jgi:hypothetical protein
MEPYRGRVIGMTAVFRRADVTARYVPKGPRPVRTAVVVNAAGECDGNTTDLATSGSGSAGKRLPGQ